MQNLHNTTTDLRNQLFENLLDLQASVGMMSFVLINASKEEIQTLDVGYFSERLHEKTKLCVEIASDLVEIEE